jgi:hypothetical protein
MVSGFLSKFKEKSAMLDLAKHERDIELKKQEEQEKCLRLERKKRAISRETHIKDLYDHVNVLRTEYCRLITHTTEQDRFINESIISLEYLRRKLEESDFRDKANRRKLDTSWKTISNLKSQNRIAKQDTSIQLQGKDEVIDRLTFERLPETCDQLDMVSTIQNDQVKLLRLRDENEELKVLIREREQWVQKGKEALKVMIAENERLQAENEQANKTIEKLTTDIKNLTAENWDTNATVEAVMAKNKELQSKLNLVEGYGIKFPEDEGFGLGAVYDGFSWNGAGDKDHKVDDGVGDNENGNEVIKSDEEENGGLSDVNPIKT